eukprot:gene10630-10788_t
MAPSAQQQQDGPTHLQPAEDLAVKQQALLRQQTPEELLDIAMSLASRSLTRTFAAFQAACNCWAADADVALTNHALEVAEASMARTIRRMELAQQLAAAVFSRDASQASNTAPGLQSSQHRHEARFRQLAELLACLHQSRQQQVEEPMAADEEEEEGEELSMLCLGRMPGSLQRDANVYHAERSLPCRWASVCA